MEESLTTLQQVVLVIVFLLPGITYQFVRERLRGRAPGQRDLGERIVRALTSSVVLDAFYLIAFGPFLVALASTGGTPQLATVVAKPRPLAGMALLLFCVIPAVLALAECRWLQRRDSARFDPTPTAWDYAFRNREECFIRARLKNGDWVGGWYGNDSFAASYPETPGLFLESAYKMNKDGSFRARLSLTSGIYLSAEDIEVLEFLSRGADSAASNSAGLESQTTVSTGQGGKSA